MLVMLAFERLKQGVCCEFQVRLSYHMRLYFKKPKKEEEKEEEVVAAAWKSVPVARQGPIKASSHHGGLTTLSPRHRAWHRAQSEAE